MHPPPCKKNSAGTHAPRSKNSCTWKKYLLILSTCSIYAQQQIGQTLFWPLIWKRNDRLANEHSGERWNTCTYKV